MTCRDCIHERVCLALIKKGLPYADDKYPAEAFCMAFRNKADFVKVVRCKDCEMKGAAFCMAGDVPLTEETKNNFCSYGERKENE